MAVVIAGAIGTAIGAYGIFEVWLKAQLPKGPLGFLRKREWILQSVC